MCTVCLTRRSMSVELRPALSGPEKLIAFWTVLVLSPWPCSTVGLLKNATRLCARTFSVCASQSAAPCPAPSTGRRVTGSMWTGWWRPVLSGILTLVVVPLLVFTLIVTSWVSRGGKGLKPSPTDADTYSV